MSQIAVIVPQEDLLPENDTQELWVQNGRLEALRGYLKRRKKRMYDSVDIGDVESILGWDEECRKFGHPSEE